MKITQLPLEKITPYERNPRNADAAVDAVAESIKAFGFRQPIVVDEAGIIIAGHARYFAAIRLGMEKVPVHVAKDLTPGPPERNAGSWPGGPPPGGGDRRPGACDRGGGRR